MATPNQISNLLGTGRNRKVTQPPRLKSSQQASKIKSPSKPNVCSSNVAQRNAAAKNRKRHLEFDASRKNKYTLPQVGFFASFGLDPETLDVMEDACDVGTQGVKQFTMLNETLSNVSFPSDETITHLSDSITKLAEVGSAENVEKIVELSKKLAQYAEEKASSPGAFTAIMNIVSGPTLAVIAASACIKLCYGYDSVSFIVAVISISAITVLSCRNGGFCDLSCLLDVVSGVSSPKPQVSTDSITDICTLLGTVLGSFFILDTKTTKSTTQKLIETLSGLDRIKSSLVKILELVIKAIEYVVNLVGDKCFGLEPLRFVQYNNEEIDNYLKDLDSLQHVINKGELYFTDDNFATLLRLIRTGQEWLRKTPETRENGGIRREIHNALSMLDRYRSAFASANYKYEGLREEPTVVMFRGGPGTGKSVAAEHLSSAVCSATLQQSDYEQYKKDKSIFVYNRHTENVYWDGYDSNKLVVYFDDFGQAKDVAGTPDNEFMNFIRAVNNFQYNLHMAAIEKKSNSVFASKFIICTTNLMEFAPESIMCPEAVNRRLGHSYVVVPKKEYTRSDTLDSDLYHRKFDFSLLPTGQTLAGEISDLHPRYQEFHETDINGKYTGRILDFDTLVNEVLASRQEKYKQFLILQQGLRDTSDAYREKFVSMETVPQGKYKTFFVEPVLNKNDSFDMLPSIPEDVSKLHSSILSDNESGDIEAGRIIARTAQMFTHVFRVPASTILSRFQFAALVKAYGSELMEHLLNVDISLDFDSFPVSHTPWYEILGSIRSSEKFSFTAVIQSLRSHIEAVFLKIRSFFSDSRLGCWFIRLKELVVKYFPAIILFLGLETFTGVFTTLCDKLMSFIFPDRRTAPAPADDAEPHSIGMSDRMHIRNRIRAKAKTAQPQMASGYDSNGYALMKSIGKTNTYTISVEEGVNTMEFKERLGFVTFVTGRLAVMPFHFYKLFKSESEGTDSFFRRRIRFAREATKPDAYCREFAFLLTGKQILNGYVACEELELNDVCLLNLDYKGVNAHRDIIDHFFDKPPMFTNPAFMLTVPDPTDKTTFEGLGKFGSSLFVNGRDMGIEDYRVRDTFSYTATTTPGDCGALVSLMNSGMSKGRIVGVHVAGTTRFSLGHAGIVKRDVLRQACTPIMSITGTIPDIDYDDDTTVSQGQFVTLGGITKPPFRVGFTDLQRSRMFPYRKPLFKPARLKSFRGPDGDFINPVEVALAKYCKPVVHIDDETLSILTSRVYNHLCTSSRFSLDKRLLTYEEAIVGIENEPDFGSLDRSTSAGYPYNTDGKGSTKKRFFGNDADFDLCSEEAVALKTKIEEEIALNKVGIRTPTLWTDSLKDELLPVEKVRIGKTRIFNVGNIELLIKTRMYFGAFSTWIMKNRISNGCAIGVNPYSEEWDQLARKLSQFTPSGEAVLVGAGDFSGFDASEMPIIHDCILEVINRWYSDGNDLIRKTMWLELTNSYHVLDGIVYEWPSSLPSGHPLTSLVNCIYNHFAFQYCWLKSVGLNVSFSRYVYLCVMGDDNIFAVHPKYRHIFTELSIQGKMKEINLTYTPEQKDEEFGDWRPLTEVEFLKRSFRFDSDLHRYVAPWRLSRLLQTVYWTNRGVSKIDTVVSNVNLCLRELSLHERDTFDTHASDIYEEFLLRYDDVDKSKVEFIDYLSLKRVVSDLDQFF